MLRFFCEALGDTGQREMEQHDRQDVYTRNVCKPTYRGLPQAINTLMPFL